MSVTAPQIVFGYHGCVRWVAERIHSGEDKDLKLTDEMENYHWLGRGIYFWENAVERAAEWALKFGAMNFKKSHQRFSKKDLEPTVIGAIIYLGNCLNLLDISGHNALIAEANQVIADLKEAEMFQLNSEPQWKHALDCISINRVCSNDDGSSRFDTVRGCFPEGNVLFGGSHILSRTHVQVSVRNPDCIIGYFRPKNLDQIFKTMAIDRK